MGSKVGGRPHLDPHMPAAVWARPSYFANVCRVLLPQRPQRVGGQLAVRSAPSDQRDLQSTGVSVGMCIVIERAKLLEDLLLIW